MRRLEYKDLGQIEEIARQCFEDTKQPDEHFDFEHFKRAVRPAMESGSMVLWVQGEPVIAFLLANYVPGLFGGKPSAYAVSRFVRPESRKFGLGSAMMEMFQAEGEARGCIHFYVGHPVGGAANGLTSLGFKHTENLFRLDV